MQLTLDDDLRESRPSHRGRGLGTGSAFAPPPSHTNTRGVREPPPLSAHCSPLRLHTEAPKAASHPQAAAPPQGIANNSTYEDLKSRLLERKKELFYSALEEPLLLGSADTSLGLDGQHLTEQGSASSAAQWHAPTLASAQGSVYYDSDGSPPIGSPQSPDLAGFRFPAVSPGELVLDVPVLGAGDSGGAADGKLRRSATVLYGGEEHHPHLFVEAPGARRRSVVPRRKRLRRLYTNVPLQVGLLVLLAADVGCTVAMCFVDQSDGGTSALRVATLLTSAIFFLEMVMLRLITDGFYDLFRRHTLTKSRLAQNIANTFVTTAALIVEVVYVGGHFHSVLFPTIVRVVKDIVVLYEKVTAGAKISENTVSQCRRRYIANGYDLDLTYITDRLIAMSWPSQSYEALYRNRMEDVVSFLDAKHPGHYKVYNLCSERSYPKSYFHGSVERFAIDDHQPCDLHIIHEFCLSADEYLKSDPKHVIVAHCKGGKGRTGMMCVSYMVWSGLQETVEAARERFGQRRTEVGSPKVQTVESPSQNQYLRYYEKCLIRKRAKSTGKVTVRFQPPILRPVFITQVTLGPLPKQYVACPHKFVAGLVAGSSGKVLWASKDIVTEGGDVSSPTTGSTGTRRFSNLVSQDREGPIQFGEYTVLVSTESEKLAECSSFKELSPKEYHKHHRHQGPQPAVQQVWLRYDLSAVPSVSGDVRFHWTLDNTPWSQSVIWTWFHTSFVNPAEGVLLTRPDVDGAHKDNEHKKYSPHFILKVEFAEP